MIPTNIVIHHSVSGPNTTIKDIDAWHKARDFTKSSLGYYVGYHYVILANGKVVQTRRDNELGCHTIPNDGKIGICLVGNFMIIVPQSVQLIPLDTLVASLQKTYNINDVKGHRDWSNTECPGDNLYKHVLEQEVSWLQQLINRIKTTLHLHV